MTCTRPQAKAKKSLDPWAPSTHDSGATMTLPRLREEGQGEGHRIERNADDIYVLQRLEILHLTTWTTDYPDGHCAAGPER